MTPADYLGSIVLPTLAEFMEAPGDQRRAYLACITAAHLVDHVRVALGLSEKEKHDVRQAVRALGTRSAACLAIVEGVSNGTKHAQPDTKASKCFKFTPGRERFVPSLSHALDVAGLGDGTWRGIGLVVGLPLPDAPRSETGHVLDDAVRAVVRSYATAFPALFAGVDLVTVAAERDRFVALQPPPIAGEGDAP